MDFTSEPTATLNFGGVHSSNGIINAWADYFGELATPTECSDSPDSDFHQAIHEKYVQFLQDTPAEVVSFSLEEVSESHKAAGPDAIEPEHLIHGGETLKVHLTALFNAIVVERYIPEAFQLGVVIPIPKGHNKDLSIPGNYCGITILSVSKVFKKLLLLKISQQSSPLPSTHCKGGSNRT